MDLDLEQLAAAVLRLSSVERAELAARLLASLEEDEAEREAYDAAWAKELDARERRADAEPEASVSAAAALAEVRRELAARRTARG